MTKTLDEFTEHLFQRMALGITKEDLKQALNDWINPPVDPPWLIFARQELGVKEIAGPSHNPRIIEYGTAVKLNVTTDEIPWCSNFANWCVKKAGIKGTESAAARSWLTWGKQVDDWDNPPVGSIVVLTRGNNPSQGHVAFFCGFEGDRVRVLGGNQGNSVCYATYPKSNVISYRVPK